MKKNNRVTGNKGEEIACKYLEKKSYKIEERNFRTRFGEIDIVCWDGQILVFVEVKTKIGHDFGEPEDMVSKSKLSQVQRMGEVYIEVNNLVGVVRSLGSARDDECADEKVSVGPGLADRGPLRPGPMEKWSGLCRVDVVAIVLFENGEIESIKHHEVVY